MQLLLHGGVGLRRMPADGRRGHRIVSAQRQGARSAAMCRQRAASSSSEFHLVRRCSRSHAPAWGPRSHRPTDRAGASRIPGGTRTRGHRGHQFCDHRAKRPGRQSRGCSLRPSERTVVVRGHPPTRKSDMCRRTPAPRQTRSSRSKDTDSSLSQGQPPMQIARTGRLVPARRRAQNAAGACRDLWPPVAVTPNMA